MELRTASLRRRYIAFTLLCLFAAAAPPATFADSKVTEIFNGVRLIQRDQVLPRQLRINILEIDPDADGISFLVTPSNGATALESTLRTTTSFMTNTGVQAAVNASFFFESAGSNANNRGVVASNGDVFSAFEEDGRPWPTLNISADNVAQIVNRLYPTVSTDVTPNVPLFNAVSGSEQIVTGGVNTAGQVSYGEPNSLHPRTLAGVKADGTVVLATIDGRQSGYSLGVTSYESADLMIGLGVVNAINLDGGGSTTMAMQQRSPAVLNRPSDGSQRAVASHIGVYANPTVVAEDVVHLADFFAGDEGRFTYNPGDASSSRGLRSTSTATAIADPKAPHMGWAQQIDVIDDPAAGGPADNPDAAWFVRHLSGTASAATNLARTSTGYIGLWARTFTAGQQISLAVDDGAATERGILQDMIADGKWRLYEWNLDDDLQWESWNNGNGFVDSANFTLDSVQIYGNAPGDARLWIDAVAHDAYRSLSNQAIPDVAYSQIVALRADDNVDGITTSCPQLANAPVDRDPAPDQKDDAWGFSVTNTQALFGAKDLETSHLADYGWNSMANGSDGEDCPTLNITVSGLDASQTYNLYFYQATSDTAAWGLRAGIGALADTYTAGDGVLLEDNGGSVNFERVFLGTVAGVTETLILIDDQPSGSTRRGYFKGIGVEIASVPEPATLLLAAGALTWPLVGRRSGAKRRT